MLFICYLPQRVLVEYVCRLVFQMCSFESLVTCIWLSLVHVHIWKGVLWWYGPMYMLCSSTCSCWVCLFLFKIALVLSIVLVLVLVLSSVHPRAEIWILHLLRLGNIMSKKCVVLDLDYYVMFLLFLFMLLQLLFFFSQCSFVSQDLVILWWQVYDLLFLD